METSEKVANKIQTSQFLMKETVPPLKQDIHYLAKLGGQLMMCANKEYDNYFNGKLERCEGSGKAEYNLGIMLKRGGGHGNHVLCESCKNKYLKVFNVTRRKSSDVYESGDKKVFIQKLR